MLSRRGLQSLGIELSLTAGVLGIIAVSTNASILLLVLSIVAAAIGALLCASTTLMSSRQIIQNYRQLRDDIAAQAAKNVNVRVPRRPNQLPRGERKHTHQHA